MRRSGTNTSLLTVTWSRVPANSTGAFDVVITADSVDPEQINTVEVWRDAEALDEFRKQANAPDMEEPKHMEVKRYDATDGGPLF